MSDDRVMLLIDADNVSADVMEQAVRLLLNQHGSLHVRRAYCTAESAVANQAMFKRLSIKPMVNLAAGKNSTDIAMAVDAIDLVLSERPDVVVIASSDSDFAPLVQRLREKGCVVRGIGQKGKVADETQDAYDDYTVLEHHRSATADKPARKAPARKTAARKVAAAKPTAGQAAARRGSVADEAPAPAAKSAVRKTAAAKKVAAKTLGRTTARKTAAERTAERTVDRKADRTADHTTDRAADRMPDRAATVPAKPAAVVPMPAPAPLHAPAATPSPRPARNANAYAGADADADTDADADADADTSSHAGRRRAAGTPRGAASVQDVLACLPELAAGQSLALNVAVQRLREAQLLGKNSSSLKLFAQLADRFDLLPAGKPNQVRLHR